MKIYNCSELFNEDIYSLESDVTDWILDGMGQNVYPTNNFLYYRFRNNLWERNVRSFLDEFPIFLVETKDSLSKMNVDNEMFVAVPADKYTEDHLGKPAKCGSVDKEIPADAHREGIPVDEETKDSFDKWSRSKWKEEDTRIPEMIEGKSEIYDLLGVYCVDTSRNALIPRKIFVWVDKIYSYSNPSALLRFVIVHELMHAFMDVTAYGVAPSDKFSYKDDFPYHYMEEAIANGVALNIVMPSISPSDQTFITGFVQSQPQAYAKGLDLYQCQYEKTMKAWMHMKVLFGQDVVSELDHFFHLGEFHIIDHFLFERTLFYGEGSLMGEVEPTTHRHVIKIGSDKVYAYSDGNCVRGSKCKWGFMDSHGKVLSPAKYDSVWSFDANGLCKVRIDTSNGYLYGYVNMQGIEQIPIQYDYINNFHEGVTLAKHNNKYGVIDQDNKTLIPFQYDGHRDIRFFAGIIQELDRTKDPSVWKIKMSDLLKDPSLLK